MSRSSIRLYALGMAMLFVGALAESGLHVFLHHADSCKPQVHTCCHADRDQGGAHIFSAHSESELCKLCNYMLTWHKGAILQDNTTSGYFLESQCESVYGFHFYDTGDLLKPLRGPPAV